MLERKPLERNEYVLPNTSAQDWELICTQWTAKKLPEQLFAVEKAIYYATEKNNPLSDEIIADLKILAKYPYPLFINFDSTERIEKIITDVCNFSLLAYDIRMELAKSFSLQTELADFLKKLNFSNEEKKAITAYVHQEADKFFFPNGFDEDRLIKHIESIQNKNELHKFAYDFIGYHRSLFFDMDNLKETFDRPYEIEIAKKEMIEKIKKVINNFRRDGFSHLTKLPEGFLNTVVNEIDDKRSSYSNETDLLQISHGGGFFHLLDFFTGKSSGYPLEKVKGKVVGYGIQVSPLGINREKNYANAKRSICLDQPAVLYAEIPKNRLHKAPNSPSEAGLMTQNKLYLTKIKLYNLLTNEVIEADNVDQLLEKITARNALDYHPKFENWIDPAAAVAAELSTEAPIVDIIKLQEQPTAENKNFNEALERFNRLKEKALKEFNQDMNEGMFLDFIRKVSPLYKRNELVLLLNSLSELGEVSFAADKPNELASAAAHTWFHGLALTNIILSRPNNEEEMLLITNATKSAANIIKNPFDSTSSNQLLVDAEKIRAKIEGGFFNRKESRIWKGLLYGALFIVVGSAFIAGSIFLAPLAAAVSTVTVLTVLLTYLMMGSGGVGILLGLFTPLVALKLSSETPDQRASRNCAESMKHLVKCKESFFNDKKQPKLKDPENKVKLTLKPAYM